jgi:hypothetical protein
MIFACWRCVKRNVLNPGDVCVVCDTQAARYPAPNSIATDPTVSPAELDQLAYRRWQEATGN